MDPEFKELLKEMQQDIRKLADKVLEISTIFSHTEVTNQKTQDRLEVLERDTTMARGSINVIKIVGSVVVTLLITAGISFCTWVVMSDMDLRKDYLNQSKDIAVLREKLQNLESGNSQ